MQQGTEMKSLHLQGRHDFLSVATGPPYLTMCFQFLFGTLSAYTINTYHCCC